MPTDQECKLPSTLTQDLLNRFSYHAPTGRQLEHYFILRSRALTFAEDICVRCPDSRERSVALTKLDEVVFWSNAAIARHEAMGAPPCPSVS